MAAGGGSRLFFRNGLLIVGPESAGADPGPVCYRKGGPLAITDANVHLGRVVPEFFPKIFGADEKQMLDAEAVEKEFAKLTAEINHYLKSLNAESVELTVDDVAYGFVKVANESMCRPIRSITEAKGYDAVPCKKRTVTKGISLLFSWLERACSRVLWWCWWSARVRHRAIVRNAIDFHSPVRWSTFRIRP